MLRCVRCNRELKGKTITIGRMNVGPKCAKFMGLELSKRIKISAPIKQESQLDLFGESHERSNNDIIE
jgi:hypothetical protein